MKVYITEHERFYYEIKDEKETYGFYGIDIRDEYDQDYFDDIPSELFEKYHKNMKEFNEIQTELHKIKQERKK